MRIPISLFLKDNILGHRDQFNKFKHIYMYIYIYTYIYVYIYTYIYV